MPRPTQAVIDLASIEANILEVKRRAGAGCRVLIAVKADAYGHGAIPVSRTAERVGVDMLGIATVEEGLELRESGITLPLLLLGQILAEEVQTALAHDITVSVGDAAFAAAVAAAARRAGVQAPVYVNVDTGMGRVGIHPWTGAAAFIAGLARERCLRVAGVFSHFPVSDEPGGAERAFCREQIRIFAGLRDSLRAAGMSAPVFSLANSGAVFDYPESYFDMIRPGIMIYGFRASPHVLAEIRLAPALALTSRIVYLKRVRRGTTLGYGRTYTVPEDNSLVATVPIGYADGFRRGYSNRAPVLISGKRYRVSGRVSMDQITVDLGPSAQASVGDPVVLIGHQGNEEIRAEELAALLDTVVHEVTCAISKRVPRVWLDAPA